MFLPIPSDRLPERLVRCIAGLALFGLGIAMFLASDLGLAPWDVFHQGVSERLGIPVGVVIEITGVFILLLWIPLRERLGLGTVLNAIEIGLVVFLLDGVLPVSGQLVPRVLYVAGGLVAIAAGSGLYIGAGLGSGPRDGLMLGLSKRGISVRVARTGVEVAALVIGLLLGGTVGVGTLAFTCGIGPLVQVFLPRLRIRGDRTVLATTH
ncbi:MAG: YczE/YyaS/YitT family protein [Actinomycetota bacterium]